MGGIDLRERKRKLWNKSNKRSNNAFAGGEQQHSNSGVTDKPNEDGDGDGDGVGINKASSSSPSLSLSSRSNTTHTHQENKRWREGKSARFDHYMQLLLFHSQPPQISITPSPMPEQATDFSPHLSMEALAIDSDDSGSEIYHTLGLKGKGVRGKPRFLCNLSSLLERSVQENEILSESEDVKDVQVTMFHGLKAPPVSIQQYIERIFKYAGCSPSCFVVAYIYVDRYLQSTDAQLSSLNVHRLLITSIMVAAKFVDDGFFNNAYYAKVGGVSTLDMNKLEMKFLFSIDFRLRVRVDTFNKYCLQLEEEGSRCQIDRPIRPCWTKETWSKKDDNKQPTTIAR